jgi:hypothetical protein
MTQWNIRTPIVYRYLPRQYVDEFFGTGAIRLSSFSEFSKHPDEEKGDAGEGKHIIVGKGTKQTVFAVTAHGHDACVLSCSAILSDELMERFNCDAAIRVKNTTAFALAIARQLPGLRQGFEGSCYYRDGSIEADIGDFELDQLRTSPGEASLDLGKLGGFALSMAGAAVYFKKREVYQHQSEYRFIWLVDHEVPGPVAVICPEARSFCEPVVSAS